MTERDELEFRQLGLIVTNLIWLALEYLWLETDSPYKFRAYRLLYFVMAGGFRAYSTYSRPMEFDEKETFVSKEFIKTTKVWFVDVASWCLVIWLFGRSIM